LLNALFNGRHCLVNSGMVEGSGLESVCHVANGAQAMRSLLLDLYTQAIRPEEIEIRRKVLSGIYNKEDNLQQLLRSIW
jgi:hypothetical protein